MKRFLRRSMILFFLFLPSLGYSQEKSVKPGINDSFRDPEVAQFVERFEGESREVFHLREKIVAACSIRPGQTVADIGAGTGLFTRRFADAVGKNGRVFAVDISQKFLDHIQETCRVAGKTNVETIRCTHVSAGLPEHSVDVAYICDTYHHFEFPMKTMASLHRALKPGGRVIIVDFERIPGKSSAWTLGHVRAGKEVVTSEVVEAGFLKTREVTGLLKENYFIEFEKSGTPGLRSPAYPRIEGSGGVVPVPDGRAQPREGAKVVLDVTGVSPPNAPHRGLERAARLLNLYAQSGKPSSDVGITVVLHGAATGVALQDEFYAERYGTKGNPNLELVRKLQKEGVEILVCGQALNDKGIATSLVAREIPVALSAMTVTIDRQTMGYAYLPVP